LAETLYGIERLPLGQRRQELSVYFGVLLEEKFRSRVLWFDEESARKYAIVATRREQIGRRMGTTDAQIAAICLANHATLAARNIKDFEETGIKLIKPWDA
jgi:predicted nucleic acid-binding protein